MYIVTGGAGFIGSNIVKKLITHGQDVVIIDDLTNSKKLKNISGLKIREFISWQDFNPNDEFFKKAEGISHQGACTDTTVTDGRRMLAQNYEFSKKLLHMCVKNKINIVYASSAAVYGNSKSFEEIRSNEKPLNVYGYSKLLFDNCVRSVADILPPVCVGLRYFNVYGPGEAHKGKMASMVYQMLKMFHENKEVKLFVGSENFKRDFVFVDDVANVNLHFLLYEGNKQGIVNVGSGRARSFTDLYDIISDSCDEDRKIFVDMPKEVKEFYQEFTEADLNLLRSLGYKRSFTRLEEGVKKMKEEYYGENK